MFGPFVELDVLPVFDDALGGLIDLPGVVFAIAKTQNDAKLQHKVWVPLNQEHLVVSP